MGLRINTNVASIRAQNSLQRTTKSKEQALTRLSTGLRINSARDDAVGLAKSESLNSQVRGATVARNNISNASAVLGVAEGYLQQLTEIAQELRDLAVQAADATLSSTDRSTLTNSLNDLQSEYGRLSTKANFNGVNLLDGTFSSKDIQVGSNKGDTIGVSIEDARKEAIGKIAVYTAQTRSVSGSSIAALSFGDPAGLSINGSTIATSAFSSDGVTSGSDADESALAYVNAINSYSGTTGVTATVNENVMTFTYTSGDTLTSAQHLVINGTTVKDSTSSYSSNDAGVSEIVKLINAKSGETGVTATQDDTTDKLILKATDGRNITVNVANAGSTDGTNAFGTTGASTARAASYRGTFELTANDAFTLNGAAGEFASGDTLSVSLDSTTTLNNVSFSSASNASTAIAILDKVIEQLQDKRAKVGSIASRFDIADAELGSRIENLSSAVSNIRDADIAAETAEFTKANILQQAGSTVLAQANSSPQIALSLLQNL